MTSKNDRQKNIIIIIYLPAKHDTVHKVETNILFVHLGLYSLYECPLV